MQRVFLIFSLLILTITGASQVIFKTIAGTKGPVVVGEPFPIQFILEDSDPKTEFFPPDFKEFRVVNVPYIYGGTVEGPDGPTKLKNIVYTLEAMRPGRFLIAGAGARVNDNVIASDDIWVDVITQAEALKRGRQQQNLSADYYLKPGEDPYRKMQDNLFLKVMVDKTTCFAGEPVTATYKLYSRLISKSAIVKNPGFYGFTVHDMIGLNDNKAETETLNGKKFDVHTIRKVQLYPLRAGEYTVDAMEVSNKVEFSRTVLSRKSEQKIIEGVVTDEDEPAALNAEEYENSISTPPVVIIVKPSPEKNKPDDFAGATGKFSINATVNKNELAKNEEGQLTIEVSGKGNFTQLTAPLIQWPEGLEGFDPKITDTLDHQGAPLKGERTFIFSFVSAKPGTYSVPPVSFSFFDPDSNRYKTVLTKAQTITISNREKITETKEGVRKTSSAPGDYNLAIYGTILGIIVITLGFVWFRKKAPQPDALIIKEEVIPSVNEILQPATAFTGEDKLFYATLRQCIWNFFTLHFGLTGSKMNSRDLIAIMKHQQADEKSQLAILGILQECETGIFTDAQIQTDRTALLNKTEESLGKLL